MIAEDRGLWAIVRESVGATLHEVAANEPKAAPAPNPVELRSVHRLVIRSYRLAESLSAHVEQDDLDGFVADWLKFRDAIGPASRLIGPALTAFAAAARKSQARPSTDGLAWRSCHELLWSECVSLLHVVGLVTLGPDGGVTSEDLIREHWSTIRAAVLSGEAFDTSAVKVACLDELQGALPDSKTKSGKKNYDDIDAAPDHIKDAISFINGERLLSARSGGKNQPLSTLVGDFLAERDDLTVSRQSLCTMLQPSRWGRHLAKPK